MGTYQTVLEGDLSGNVFLITGGVADLAWQLVTIEAGSITPTEYANRHPLRDWGEAIRSVENAALALMVREASIVDARLRPWILVRGHVHS
jgi:hypothetical protein